MGVTILTKCQVCCVGYYWCVCVCACVRARVFSVGENGKLVKIAFN